MCIQNTSEHVQSAFSPPLSDHCKFPLILWGKTKCTPLRHVFWLDLQGYRSLEQPLLCTAEGLPVQYLTSLVQWFFRSKKDISRQRPWRAATSQRKPYRARRTAGLIRHRPVSYVHHTFILCKSVSTINSLHRQTCPPPPACANSNPAPSSSSPKQILFCLFQKPAWLI